MEVKFNLAKDERKRLVGNIGDITGEDVIYHGAPSFAFSVGGFTIGRDGTFSCGDEDSEVANSLLPELAARGFAYQEQKTDAPEPENTAPDRLSIDVPLDNLTPDAIARLEKLVAAKAWIFRKMTGAQDLPIEQTEDRLCFPWFKPDASAQEIEVYTHLATRLCETAKTKQRVTASERPPLPGESEKFKARCMLLALGFIGSEFAQARKILLAPTSGSGSKKQEA